MAKATPRASNNPYKKKGNIIGLEQGKIPPQAVELEEAVLGALMIDKNALNEVRILASIRNPNIIGYKEVFLDERSNSMWYV